MDDNRDTAIVSNYNLFRFSELAANLINSKKVSSLHRNRPYKKMAATTPENNTRISLISDNVNKYPGRQEAIAIIKYFP